MVTRADYVAALKRERSFVESQADYAEDARAQRLDDIDTELARFGEGPKADAAADTDEGAPRRTRAAKGAPETA